MINTNYISIQFGADNNPITHKVPKTTYQALRDKVSELFQLTAKFHFEHVDQDGDVITVDCENDLKFVTPATLLRLAIDPVVRVRDYRDITRTHEFPKTSYQDLCDKVSELFQLTTKFHFEHVDQDGDIITVDCENDMKFVTPDTLLRLAIDPVVRVRDYRDITKTLEFPKTSYQDLCDKVSALFQITAKFYFDYVDQDGDTIDVDSERDMPPVTPTTLLRLVITPSSTPPTTTPAIIPAISSSRVPSSPFFPVANLMERFSNCWIAETGEFDFSNDSFDLGRLVALFKRHAERFGKEEIDHDDHFGFIEKIDLDPRQNPKIYMRADLHGDLKSLLENLRSLQIEGLLDQNFRCATGFHLVFLGDYCDRGAYGTQILELLASLQMENPEQVHLIRGNHESSLINNSYCGLDGRLRLFCSEAKTREALDKFYETMPLTTYISLACAERREYVQCTHGLFELSVDPSSLLDDEASYAYIPVSKVRKLSDRIKRIEQGKTDLAISAMRITNLFKTWKHSDSDLTAYNWGDVALKKSEVGYLSTRGFALNALDIKHYFNLSSDRHDVKMLFRGHQHLFQNLMHHNTVIATTLPVGVDCPIYRDGLDPAQNPDKAYVIIPRMKVGDWIKHGLVRYSKQQITDTFTPGYPLISNGI